MQTQSSDQNSACPSVRLTVCQTRGLWQNGRKISPDFYTIRKIFSVVFWEEEWLVGATPSTWNFGSTGPRWSKVADFEPIFARSASAIAPSEKSWINANRKFTTRFPMSLRWSSCVAHATADFRKNRTSLEESLLQSYFVWKLSAAKL